MKENIYQRDFKVVPKVFDLIKTNQNLEAIEYFEQNPTEINLKGWMDHTPLHQAAEYGNYDLVKYLIENGAEINARRSVYATPLCWAKTVEIAKLLLDNGATMNDQELDMATRDDRTEVIDELLSRGAKINYQEPQFLNCHSIKTLDIYLKHGIDISLTDNNKTSILHSKAWSDNVEVFEHAFRNGAKWGKDSSNRTPYVLAKQGRREKIIDFLTSNYPELTSHRVTKVDNIDILSFEQIYFFSEHPNQKNVFYALTQSSKIVKYIIKDEKFVSVKAISIDISTIRNFAINDKFELIVPTADDKLLKINSDTLESIEYICLENQKFDQITYLINKRVYLASNGGTCYVLNTDFKVLSGDTMENGVFYPLINKNEDLVAVYSYDQETYHDLYRFSDENELKHIYTFFIEWNNSSEGFDFKPSDNEFAVSYPKILSLCELVDGKIETKWSVDISEFHSEHDISDLVFIDDELLVLGKGKRIVLFSVLSGELMSSMILPLKAEIRGLKRNISGDLLIIRTHLEIVPLEVVKIKNVKTIHQITNDDISSLKECTEKQRLPWFKRFW